MIPGGLNSFSLTSDLPLFLVSSFPVEAPLFLFLASFLSVALVVYFFVADLDRLVLSFDFEALARGLSLCDCALAAALVLSAFEADLSTTFFSPLAALFFLPPFSIWNLNLIINLNFN